MRDVCKNGFNNEIIGGGMMLNIDSVEKGLVIDHIKAGKAMEIYHYLNLDKMDCSVAIIKNAKSKKYGKKDIIKIENNIDMDFKVLGFIDPNITINIIDDSVIIDKINLELPREVENVVKCKNPRCTVLRKGKYIGTVDVETTSKEQMSEMMVGRKISFNIEKKDIKTGEAVLEVENLTIKAKNSKKNMVNNVSFAVKGGEILCIAGIDGNGQSELVYGITGLMPIQEGRVLIKGKDITRESVRKKSLDGMSHIPEDRHKHGLVLDFNLQQNAVLQTYFEPRFQNKGFIKFNAVAEYARKLIKQYDIRSPRDEDSIVRNMSGGNQQKLIVARELDRDPDIVIAVQPTRGLDIGATEYIHKQLVAQRDQGKAVLLVSLELDEVMDISDRILVIYEGEIVGDLNPKEITVEELGLYMAGSKRSGGYEN
jgi:aspartate carbamoyltransferase regulatory subunit